MKEIHKQKNNFYLLRLLPSPILIASTLIAICVYLLLRSPYMFHRVFYFSSAMYFLEGSLNSYFLLKRLNNKEKSSERWYHTREAKQVYGKYLFSLVLLVVAIQFNHLADKRYIPALTGTDATIFFFFSFPWIICLVHPTISIVKRIIIDRKGEAGMA